MQYSPALHTVMRIISVLTAAHCLSAQTPAARNTEVPAKAAQGLPPRAAPADYQVQAQAGTVTLAAEFTAHGVPSPQGALSTEDFVVVEIAIFGPPDARLTIAPSDFSLKINGKKTALPSQPYGLVAKSLKDPEWAPPESAAPKSKTSLGGSGGGGQGESNTPPPPVKVPVELQRAWQQRIQKAALAEGDRALPQAGLIFFQYRGKTEGIHSVELIYSGPAGTATLALQQ